MKKIMKLCLNKIIILFGFILFSFILIAPYIWPIEDIEAKELVPLGKSPVIKNEPETVGAQKIINTNEVESSSPSAGEEPKTKTKAKKKNYVIQDGVKTVKPLEDYKSLFTAPETKNSDVKVIKKDADLNDLPDISMRDVKKDGIVGIYNRGNSCYADSVIQMLFRIPVFRKIVANFEIYRPVATEQIIEAQTNLQETENLIIALGDSDPNLAQNFDEHVESTKDSIKKIKRNVSIIEGLNHMFHQLQTHSKGKAASFKFEKTEQCLQDEFHYTNQEDANEYMVRVISALTNFIPKEQEQLRIQIKGETSKKYLANDPGTNKNHGKYFGITSVLYDGLHLAFPEEVAPSALTLKSFLERFFEADSTEYKCDGETVPVGRLEQATRITSLPEIVSIQIKRYVYNRFRQQSAKIYRTVNVPDEIDFAPYCCDDYKLGTKYQLKMFIYHVGESHNSGHYIAFSRENDGNWYELDDNTVTLIPKFSDHPEKNDGYYLNEKDGKIYGEIFAKRKGELELVHGPINDVAYIYFYERNK